MLARLRHYVPESFKPVLRAIRYEARQVWNLPGARYRCPVCGGRVRKFRPLPEHLQRNLRRVSWKYPFTQLETCNVESYSCPLCNASDRSRLYALYLRDYLTQVKSSDAVRIIDFAPSRPLTLFIRKLASRSVGPICYRTADLMAQGVDDKVDIQSMPHYADNQFDFFICSHVLEHVRDDRRALCELHRILKPGGKGILMVPVDLSVEAIDEDSSVTDADERRRRFGQDDHVRLYSKRGFIERVENAGFGIEGLGSGFFGEGAYAENGIAGRSVLYVVEKPIARKPGGGS